MVIVEPLKVAATWCHPEDTAAVVANSDQLPPPV
jgi:hypothetical protein